jgi:PucR-like helix-turn-helix protein/diguanylate cyclase with GGDEF domain
VDTDVGGRVNSRKSMRAELLASVRGRRGEIEQAIFVRVRDDVYGLEGSEDPEYIAGLKMAVGAAIEHGLEGIEVGEEGVGAAPPEAISQARRAARAGVSFDTVVRRYLVGSAVLGDFLMQEAERPELEGCGSVLREVLRTQAAVLERMVGAVNLEYECELERAGRSPEQRRAERALRLLGGGSVSSSELGYELEHWHLGTIVTGTGAVEALNRLAGELGRGLLCVPRGEGMAWGWLGGREAVSGRDVERVLAGASGAVSVAIGEPGWGVEGWRLTHRQAQAALRVALRSGSRLTRYADVALLASVLRDETLSGSLVEIYLSPLGDVQNGGAVLRKTLRAYFAAERNASSAASALGVTRHTVENRLRAIEDKLGQSLRTRQAELEVALRLEELGDRGNAARPSAG